MKLTVTEKKLLALHYFFPVPLNRLKILIERDPELAYFHTYSVREIAEILNIKIEKASQLRENIMQNLTTSYEKLYAQHAILPIPYTHSYYPKQLLDLIDPPVVLYAQGDISLLQKRSLIAIIGSRKAALYSKKALTLIVPPLVENQQVIVSGLAKGADTLAHQATIYYGGKTIAVLGHGFFHLYPQENRIIRDEMIENHLLLTEYPPYVRPAKWTFPMRNRIISGLSEVVIVTEAAKKSGTMSTVEHALDHGKDVYAVPGPITSPLSEGPNRLIEEGARPLWNGFQVIEALL